MNYRQINKLYQLTVKGILREDWNEWFGGLTITHEADVDGEAITIITGPVRDQAALHGILAMLRDLNLELIAIRKLTVGNSSYESEVHQDG